jgi:hypothetical protein
MPHSIRTFQEVLVAVAALTAAAAPFAAPTVSAAGSDGEMVKQTFPIPGVGGDLGEPDRGFHRFDLAEERTDAPAGPYRDSKSPTRRRCGSRAALGYESAQAVLR